jgi:hypothetical protein
MPTNVKLANVPVGKPAPPREFDNDLREYVNLDPREEFLKRLDDRKVTDWKTNRAEQSLFLRHAEIPEDATMFHRNYLEYLEKCWADHLGIVITPDILWFTVLNELVAVVKNSPEPYRHLFTDSHEKKEIWVMSAEPVVMPLNRLVGSLRQHVPTDVGQFMPEYSTTSQRSRHAMYASFCDLCSPYYEYGMYLCDFPAISIQGTADDWCGIAEDWLKLKPLFTSVGKWFDEVSSILMSCYENRDDKAWWQSIFALEECGSGHQATVSGWFSELFREGPEDPAYVGNFPTNVAQVDYKAKEILEDEAFRTFKMQDGLFFSHQEGDFMVPDFGYTVHEKLEPVVTEKGDMEIQAQAIENTGTRTLDPGFKVEMGETVVAYHAADADAVVEMLKKDDE